MTFLSSLWTTEILDLLILETNCYALEKKQSKLMAPRSRMQAWEDITVSEDKAFLAILICPQIHMLITGQICHTLKQSN